MMKTEKIENEQSEIIYQQTTDKQERVIKTKTYFRTRNSRNFSEFINIKIL